LIDSFRRRQAACIMMLKTKVYGLLDVYYFWFGVGSWGR